MSIVCTTVHSTGEFTYHKADHSFVAEESDLGRPGFSRVYDDACDEGFIMRSHVTGHEVLFVYESTDTDGEDVYGWRFRSFMERGRDRVWRKMTTRDFTVLIIND
jgi:hypothetical protein